MSFLILKEPTRLPFAGTLSGTGILFFFDLVNGGIRGSGGPARACYLIVQVSFVVRVFTLLHLLFSETSGFIA